MKTTLISIGILSLAVALTPPDFADSKIAPASNENDDITVDTRGLVHEAFAAPVNSSPRPGPVVDKNPPQPIKELPPDQKPEGDNVQWIPGYWGWDTDRKDFVWVSGFWRVPPPHRKWVPGHWSESDGGSQWTAGFWAPADQETVPYLDQAPPESLENGPNLPAPDDTSMYVPGNWVPQSDGYAWQSGYWSEAQPNYVWTPSQYIWTPAGYCYVNGYWDYPLEGRGLLFAPVYFRRRLWLDPDWYYQPSYCLPFGGLFSSLFAWPFWNHYCFGDYYGAGYFNSGFYPWFDYGRRWHDPLFGYYNWRNRDNPGWFNGLARDFRGRTAGNLARPPRTLAQQNALVRNFNNGALDRRTLNSLQTVRPLSQMAGNGVHLASLTSAQATAARQNTAAFRQVSQDRQRLERSAGAGTGRPSALSLAHVPTQTGARGVGTATASGSPRRSGYRGSPYSAYGSAPSRGAITSPRGIPESAYSGAQPGPAHRSGSGASPFVNHPSAPAQASRNAVHPSPNRYSGSSSSVRHNQSPAPSASNHAAHSSRTPARPAAPHNTQHAGRGASHASAAHHAAPAHQGGGGHSGSGGHGGGGGHAAGGGHGGGHGGSGHGGGGGGHSGGGHDKKR
jgi:hypothetical protein